MLYRLPNHLPSSSFGIAFKVSLLTARKIFLLYSRTLFLNPKQMSRQVSRGSAGEYQADEWAGVAQLSWRGSGR